MEKEQAIVFIVHESFRRRCFFAYADEEDLVSLLLKVPSDTMMEFVSKEKENPLEKVFIKGNMDKYASYIRKTVYYKENHTMFQKQESAPWYQKCMIRIAGNMRPWRLQKN